MGSVDSIFDVLGEKIGIAERLISIDFLFSSEKCIDDGWLSIDVLGYTKSIEAFAGGTTYLKWPHRNGTARPEQLREVLGIADLEAIGDDRAKACHYLEYVRNMTEFVYGCVKEADKKFDSSVFESVIDDSGYAAGLLGLKFEVDRSGRSVLCANDAPVMAAAAMADPGEMEIFINYYHFTSEGDVGRKSGCLAGLYKCFEARLPKLNGAGFDKLCDEISALANSLDTRHNNRDGRNAKAALESMTDSELEQWYDYLAGLYAEAVLAERRAEMREKSQELRSKLRERRG